MNSPESRASMFSAEKARKLKNHLRRLRRKNKVSQKWDAINRKWGLYVKAPCERRNASAYAAAKRAAMKDIPSPEYSRARSTLALSTVTNGGINSPSNGRAVRPIYKSAEKVLPLKVGRPSVYRLGFWNEPKISLKASADYKQAFYKNLKFLKGTWTSNRTFRSIVHFVTRFGCNSRIIRTAKYIWKSWSSGKFRRAEFITKKLAMTLWNFPVPGSARVGPVE